jgi:hypothetical protein
MPDPDLTVQQMIRQDIRDMRADFNQRLDRLVTTEAFAAESRRVDDRFTAMARDVANNQLSRERAMADERTAREAEDTAIRAGLTKTANLIRWTVAAVIIPVAALVVMIFQSTGKA